MEAEVSVPFILSTERLISGLIVGQFILKSCCYLKNIFDPKTSHLSFAGRNISFCRATTELFAE